MWYPLVYKRKMEGKVKKKHKLELGGDPLEKNEVLL